LKDRQGSKELNIERTNIRFGHKRNALGECKIFWFNPTGDTLVRGVEIRH
jgi:hypothetical protein